MANNHYETILLIDEPTLRHTGEEVTIESPCPSSLEQPICLDDCQSPKDLVYRMQALLKWRTKGRQDWQQHYGNVYFYLKISCLQLHNSKLTIEHVTMAADTFPLLSQDHLHFLWQQELLEKILEKLRKWLVKRKII